MILLVDANLSPAVAAQLRDAGHDAVHVIDVNLATAIDPEIVEYAEANDMVGNRLPPARRWRRG